MPTTIDYATEQTAESLLTKDFIDEVHRHIGLDPSLDESLQPVDVLELISEAISTIEQNSNRFILQKTVNLELSENLICFSDRQLFIPYGVPINTPSMTFQASAASPPVVFTDFLVSSSAPCYLWTKEWPLSTDENVPHPVKISYTTGYSDFNKIPKSTLAAIKIYCHHSFQRDTSEPELPKSFWHHCFLVQIAHRRIDLVYGD